MPVRSSENVSMATPIVYLPRSAGVSDALDEGRDNVARMTPADTNATAACKPRSQLTTQDRQLTHERHKLRYNTCR